MDTSVTTLANVNSPGSFKFKVIAGTAAGSPTISNDAAIQSNLGPGVAWIRLADVMRAAGTDNVTNANITDTRSSMRVRIGVTPRAIDLTGLNGGANAGSLVTDGSGNVGVGQPWWTELGRSSGANVTTLTVSSIVQKRYLKIMYFARPSSPTSSVFIRFNGDTANNYTYRVSENGGGDSTGTASGIPADNAASPGSGSLLIGNLEGLDVTGAEKIFFGHIVDTFSTGINPPRRRETHGKWTGTAAITSVTIVLSSSASTAEIVILGHD